MRLTANTVPIASTTATIINDVTPANTCRGEMTTVRPVAGGDAATGPVLGGTGVVCDVPLAGVPMTTVPLADVGDGDAALGWAALEWRGVETASSARDTCEEGDVYSAA